MESVSPSRVIMGWGGRGAAAAGLGHRGADQHGERGGAQQEQGGQAAGDPAAATTIPCCAKAAKIVWWTNCLRWPADQPVNAPRSASTPSDARQARIHCQHPHRIVRLYLPLWDSIALVNAVRYVTTAEYGLLIGLQM
jgi:hypothetical protein